MAVKIEVINLNKARHNIEELELSYYMADANIGPKIYETFFIDITNKHQIVQVSIMEPFSMDCRSAFNDKSIDISLKKQILLKIIHLIKKQIFKYGMYCTNIKQGNCVCNLMLDDEIKC